MTHSGRLPLGIAPLGVVALSEPAIDSGFVLILNMHDANDKIIGFAVELEVHPEGDMLAEDLRWTSSLIVCAQTSGRQRSDLTSVNRP